MLTLRQWTAQVFEWGTVWLLLQKDGLVSKEDMRRVYDVGLSCRFGGIMVICIY
jgi:hypothetical protein